MPNSFYNHGGYPSPQSPGSSAAARAEFDAIQAGFDKMPTLTGNAGQFVIVNASANGLTTTSASQGISDATFRLSDDVDATKIAMFQVSGISPSTTRTFAFPDANTTLVGTDTAQTLTNKIVNAVRANGAAVQALSNSLSAWTSVAIGRNTIEGHWGISGAAGQLTTGDVAGDATLRTEQRLWLSIGASGQMRLDAANGVVSFASFSGAGAVIPYTPSSSLGVGTIAGFPALVFWNAGAAADNKRWDIYANSTTLIHRIVNDANNAAANWLEVIRAGMTVNYATFSTLWGVGVGGAPTNYGANIRQLAVHAVQQPVVDLMLNGVRDGTFTTTTAGVIMGTVLNKPVSIAVEGANKLTVENTVITTNVGMRLFGTDQLIRLNNDAAYLAFWNTAASARNGYIQNITSGDFIMAKEGVGNMSFSVGAGVRLGILSDGRIYTTSSHNNASGMAGTALQFLGSATYTPSATVGTGVSSVTGQNSYYTRVGNVVSLVARFSLVAPSGGVASFTFGVPIATTLPSGVTVVGAGVVTGGAGSGSAPNTYGTVTYAGGATSAQVNITTPGSGSAIVVFVHLQYEV